MQRQLEWFNDNKGYGFIETEVDTMSLFITQPYRVRFWVPERGWTGEFCGGARQQRATSNERKEALVQSVAQDIKNER